MRGSYPDWCCSVGTHRSSSPMPSCFTSACSKPRRDRRRRCERIIVAAEPVASIDVTSVDRWPEHARLPPSGGRCRSHQLAILAAVLTGALVGLGAFTFDYGEGLSYFSTDPVACKNCHVMNEQYASWTKAPHHAVAEVHRLSSASRPDPEVHRQSRQRLPALQGIHVHGLPRADPITRAERADAPGELRALPCATSCTTSCEAARPARTPSSCVHCHRGVGSRSETVTRSSRAPPSRDRRRRSAALLVGIVVLCALLVFVVAGLLTSIFERKQEARNPYVRLVEVSEETTDPAPWGVNWPREYDDYRRTAEPTKTRFGGSESLARGEGRCVPVAHPDVRRVRVRARLSGSTRARLHARRIRSRRGASPSGRSPAPACSATPR